MSDEQVAQPQESQAAEDWRASLPAQLRDAPYIREAKTAEEAFAGIKGAAEYMGNSLRIPSADAGPEAMQQFYQRVMEKAPGLMRKPDTSDPASFDAILTALGKPDSADKYTLPDIEGYQIPDERIGRLKAIAHEAGLTADQAAKLYQTMLSDEANSQANQLSDHQAQMQQLRGEWGMAFESRMAAARRALEATKAPADVMAAFDNGSLAAEGIRWMFGLSQSLGAGEGGQVASQGNQSAPLMTPAEARAQLEEIGKRIIGKRPSELAPGEYERLAKKRVDLMRLATAAG